MKQGRRERRKTMLGTLLANLIFGNIYTWSNISGYYNSYLVNQRNQEISYAQMYFITPIGLSVSGLTPILGSLLLKHIRLKTMMKISMIMIFTTYIMTALLENIYLIYFAFFIHGFGVGLSFYPIIQNCWSFYPKRIGKVTGLIFSAYGGSSLIFTVLADLIVNPEGHSSSDGNYGSDVSKRFPIFLIFFISSVFILGILAMCLIDQKTTVETNVENIEKFSEEHIDKEPVSQALKSGKLILVCLFVVSLMFNGFLVSNTYRNFGMISNMNETLLHILPVAYSIMNCSFRIVWGLIYDCIGFFTPCIIICIVQLVTSSLFFFSRNYDITYFVCTTISVIPFSGIISLYPSIINYIFGKKNSGMICSVVGLCASLSPLLGPILIQVVLGDSRDPENYLFVYLLGTGFTFFGFVLLLILGKNKYEYTPGEKVPITYENEPLLDDGPIIGEKIHLKQLE